MKFFQRFWGHLRTVQKHRKAVRKLCFKCGLYWQGLTHDLSKYSPTEFWLGVKYFTGTASPHVGERRKKGYSDAWLHHHNRNKHHSDYWMDIEMGRPTPVDMPLKYKVEMFCDRVAACQIYLKDKYSDSAPLSYFLGHTKENLMSSSTQEWLLNTLSVLDIYGLECTCTTLKAQLKENKKQAL